MKKLLPLLLLLLMNFTIYAQFVTGTFDSSSIINTVSYDTSKTGGSNNCITSLTVDFTFPSLLSQQGTGYQPWGHHYTIKVTVIGYRNDGSNQTILSKTYNRDDYVESNSEGYIYRTIVLPENITEDYTSIKAHLEIFYHYNNNDPSMIIYFTDKGSHSKWTSEISGCEPEGNADLTIDENNSTTIVNTSMTTTRPLSTNITEYIYTNSEIQINLKVKNEGEVESGNYKVGFYLSTDNNISNSQLLLEKSFSNTLSNSSQTKNISISHWYFANKLGVLGIAYIHIKLDIDEEVDEGDGESNNSFSSRRVNIKNTISSKPPKYLIPLKPQKGSDTVDNPYTLYIHDFSGTKVLEKNIQNKTFENEVISNLPKGFYILNSIHGSRKIYVKE